MPELWKETQSVQTHLQSSEVRVVSTNSLSTKAEPPLFSPGSDDASTGPRAYLPSTTNSGGVCATEGTNTQAFSSGTMYAPSLILKASHPPTCPFHLPSSPHPSGLTSHFLRTACPATPNQVRFPGDRFYSSLYFTSKDWSLLLLKTRYLTQGHGYNKALKKYMLNKQTSVNLWSPPPDFTKKQALKN